MSDSTESGSSRNPLDPDDILGAGPDRGQERDVVNDSGTSGSDEEESSYVDGDYGDAGVVDEAAASGVEGEYTSGNYGSGGESEVHRAAGGGDEGEYPDGDYGAAGSTSRGPGGAGELEEGEYPEGDYGEAGKVEGEKYPKAERPWEGSQGAAG